jgi:RsiW-degrading membrane proteinase PrsW (M82 family)
MRRRAGTLRKALVGLGVCAGAILGLLILIGFGVQLGGRDLRITMLMAFVPVPFYVFLVLWLDRMEKEPASLLALAFFYGATFATCLASIPNMLFEHALGRNFAVVTSAPIGEEFFKGLFVLGIFLLRRDEFDGVIDGVVYAAMVGLGFAAVENLEYYGKVVHEASEYLPSNSTVEHGVAVGIVFVLRGVLGPFAHPLFTAMTGVGLGLSQQIARGVWRVILPLIGYALAVTLHATWNATAALGGLPYFAAAYVLVFVPTFIGLTLLARYSLRREAILVREQLLCDVNNGFLSPTDYEMLCSLRGRRDDLRAARQRGGRTLAGARRAFHQTATDLAFHRFRVSRGITQADGEIEAGYFRALGEIQKRIAAMTGGA